MTASQNGDCGGLCKRRRMDEARIVRRLKYWFWFTRRRIDLSLRVGRLQVHDPTVPAEQHAATICFTQLGQSLRRQRSNPSIQPVRTQIECASHQLFKSVDIKGFQVRQAGAEFAQRLKIRLSR